MELMGRMQIERQYRIDLIRKELIQAWEYGTKEIDLKSLEANFCYKLGISKRSFKEYLEIAMYLCNSEIRGEKIIYKNGKQLTI